MKFKPALILGLLLATPAYASNIEYHMHMPPSQGGKRLALTFDACMGKVDERILGALVDNKIKATIFVTERWLKYNAKAIAIMKANSDLFEIENHGAMHLPAIDVAGTVYGLKTAGSPEAVSAEVKNGAASLHATFGRWPQWYRGATALYTASSMELVKTLGFKLGGFSISGDGGSAWSQAHTAKAFAAAKDGDVVIAHINQPTKPAGAGVVEGMLKLKQQGFSFVTLNEGFNSPVP